MQEMQETQIRSLGWEDPLEEGMETHSSILAWKIPWTEEPGGLRSVWSQRVRHDWAHTQLTQTPEWTDNTLLLFKPPRMWCLVTLGPVTCSSFLVSHSS